MEDTSSDILRPLEKQITPGSVWFGLCDTGWKNSLLFHPVGLRTQDETEEILIWNSWSCICSRWSSTSLVVKPGALKREYSDVS